MAENEIVVENNTQPAEPTKGQKFVAGLKERWRKFLVSLKRKPQRIAFFVLLLSTVIYMCSLFSFSQATMYYSVNWMGLLIFINTMFSILTLLLFMNTFPKRKHKMNIVMLVLTFVFMAIMLFCDIYWYITIQPLFAAQYGSTTNPDVLEKLSAMTPAFSAILAHLVLVALSAVLLATLPLYKKLILKINTTKVLEENKLSEEIDTSAEV